jgi:sec-independent protein translocase protein TatA
MGIGFRELIIILVIAIVIFGTKRLGNIGADLGKAVSSFKKGVQGEDEKKSETASLDSDKKD